MIRVPLQQSGTDKRCDGEQDNESRYTPALRKIAFDAPIFHVISVVSPEEFMTRNVPGARRFF
jgi:hypothetical protein